MIAPPVVVLSKLPEAIEVIPNVEVVAFARIVLPMSVVEAAKRPPVALRSEEMVVEPVTASEVEVAPWSDEPPSTVSVPVAVTPDAVMLPLKNPLPATESAANGDVVPIPTLPPIKVATTGFVCVVEAMNAAMVPREKMPEMPTSRPPPA